MSRMYVPLETQKKLHGKKIRFPVTRTLHKRAMTPRQQVKKSRPLPSRSIKNLLRVMYKFDMQNQDLYISLDVSFCSSYDKKLFVNNCLLCWYNVRLRRIQLLLKVVTLSGSRLVLYPWGGTVWISYFFTDGQVGMGLINRKKTKNYDKIKKLFV